MIGWHITLRDAAIHLRSNARMEELEDFARYTNPTPYQHYFGGLPTEDEIIQWYGYWIKQSGIRLYGRRPHSWWIRKVPNGRLHLRNGAREGWEPGTADDPVKWGLRYEELYIRLVDYLWFYNRLNPKPEPSDSDWVHRMSYKVEEVTPCVPTKHIERRVGTKLGQWLAKPESRLVVYGRQCRDALSHWLASKSRVIIHRLRKK